MSEAVNHGNLGRELISFRIGAQEFCVDIMEVREIRGWTPATPLPQAPAFVRGVINLRGAVLPIVDLGARLGLGAADPTARHVIIVAQVQNQIVGLLVDAVSDILTVSRDDIHQVPEGNSIDTELLNGIVTHDNKMVGLIDLHAVVSGARAEA